MSGIRCPRCGEMRQLDSDDVTAGGFCGNPYRGKKCDYPLFLESSAQSDDGSVADGRSPDDRIPEPPDATVRVVTAPAPQRDRFRDPNWEPSVADERRPRLWRGWPIVAVIGVIDVVLLVFVIRNVI